ncbi:MAG: acyltransferase [Clostridiaceae bacterium]
METKRINYLDSLRGIASLVVVVFHCLVSFNLFYMAYYNNQYSNGLIKAFTMTPLHTVWAGKEAVLLFFVLSGFVLSIPYLENKELPYKSYIIKRFFRIYLPYIIIMTLSVIIAMSFMHYNSIQGLSDTYNKRWDHPVSIESIIAYIFMINSDTFNVNGVVWTLYIEMKLSLLFPLIMIIIKRYNWIKASIIALAANAAVFFIMGTLVRYISNAVLKDIVGYFNDSLYYGVFFILGAILSKCRGRISENTLLKKHGILLFILSLIMINNKWLYILGLNRMLVQDFICGAGFALLFMVVLSSEKAQELLCVKPLLFFGKISYSIYLVHVPVIMVTTAVLSRIIPIEIPFIAAPFVCILIACISYRYIELPSMRIGKQLSYEASKIIKLQSAE